LSAKLFQTDETQSVVDEIRASPVCKYGFGDEAEGIIAADTNRLQRFVKTQFLCIPARHRSCQLQDFISGKVFPCVQVATSGWSGTVVTQAHDIAHKLRSGNLSSLEDLNMKMGCAVAAGASGAELLDHADMLDDVNVIELSIVMGVSLLCGLFQK